MLAADRTIFVDVDGTLLVSGQLCDWLVDWLRLQKAAGFVLVLWSSRGMGYAMSAANLLGVSDLFDLIISKPRYIVDDKGWGWCHFSPVIPLDEIKEGGWKELPNL